MKKELIAELFVRFENACENAGESISNHFADIGKMVLLGSGSEHMNRTINQYTN
ncbi:MAG: hypothetical protein WDM90_20720 [Ferruginibacter sp.]